MLFVDVMKCFILCFNHLLNVKVFQIPSLKSARAVHVPIYVFFISESPVTHTCLAFNEFSLADFANALAVSKVEELCSFSLVSLLNF